MLGQLYGTTTNNASNQKTLRRRITKHAMLGVVMLPLLLLPLCCCLWQMLSHSADAGSLTDVDIILCRPCMRWFSRDTRFSRRKACEWQSVQFFCTPWKLD